MHDLVSGIVLIVLLVLNILSQDIHVFASDLRYNHREPPWQFQANYYPATFYHLIL